MPHAPSRGHTPARSCLTNPHPACAQLAPPRLTAPALPGPTPTAHSIPRPTKPRLPRHAIMHLPSHTYLILPCLPYQNGTCQDFPYPVSPSHTHLVSPAVSRPINSSPVQRCQAAYYRIKPRRAPPGLPCTVSSYAARSLLDVPCLWYSLMAQAQAASRH